jgi:hypothetical protein
MKKMKKIKMDLIDKYLGEKKVTLSSIKKEIAELKASQARGKLKPAGKKRLERLEDFLIKKGIFDF